MTLKQTVFLAFTHNAVIFYLLATVTCSLNLHPVTCSDVICSDGMLCFNTTEWVMGRDSGCKIG